MKLRWVAFYDLGATSSTAPLEAESLEAGLAVVQELTPAAGTWLVSTWFEREMPNDYRQRMARRRDLSPERLRHLEALAGCRTAEAAVAYFERPPVPANTAPPDP